MKVFSHVIWLFHWEMFLPVPQNRPLFWTIESFHVYLVILFFLFFWLFILKVICVFFSNRIYFRIWLLSPPKLKLKSFMCFELASSWIFFKVWLHLHPFTRFLFIQQLILIRYSCNSVLLQIHLYLWRCVLKRK